MLKDGFLRFCDDPEIVCCRAEAELGRLRTENAQLRAELQEAQRRADAAVEDLREAIFNADVNSCTFCLHANPDVNAAPYCLADFCDNDEWKWRGRKEQD